MTTQQIIKDYTSIVIARQSALKAAQGIVDTYQLKLSVKQFIRLVDRFYQFIESGDRSWIDGLDNFLKLEDNKNFENLVK
jgi:hypothetical protein